MDKTGDYNENRVLEYRRWDDYIKSLHFKLDDISNDMELMFYDPLRINAVCSKMLVLISKNKSYMPDFIVLYSKLIKIYDGLHDKDYSEYIKNGITKTNNKQVYDKRKAQAILDIMKMFEKINENLSENELNPKPLVKVEQWWKAKLNDPEVSDDEKLEIKALKEAGLI